MGIEYREIGHGTSEYQDACLLRNFLLREPLGLDLFAEDLAGEAGYCHVAGFDRDGQLVAYLHFRPMDEFVLKMQQVAVTKQRQGTGVGRNLIGVAEEIARGRGCNEIILHAREEVTGFYIRLGYECVGGRFEEIGIPHFKMRKALRP